MAMEKFELALTVLELEQADPRAKDLQLWARIDQAMFQIRHAFQDSTVVEANALIARHD
jgi:hypothetical protein